MRIDDLAIPPEAAAKFEHLLADLRGVELPQPTGWFVLAVQYRKPEKSKGGIILTDKTKQEDDYQGRCGLVIAAGPDAYKGDKFTSAWCGVGDVIAWPAMENAANRMKYAGVVVTAIPDDRVVLRGVDPERVA
jgi:co-chaperonin GroES (HSP10)